MKNNNKSSLIKLNDIKNIKLKKFNISKIDIVYTYVDSNDSKWKNMGATIGSSDVALCWLQLTRPLSSSSRQHYHAILCIPIQ